MKLSLYEHTIRALVYADSPEKQARIFQEAAAAHLLPRLVMPRAYSLIYKSPTLIKKILSAPYVMQGMEVLAFGRNSTVISEGDTVVKLARASESMSSSEQRDLIKELERRHATSQAYLGSFCVDQVFDVINHPLHDRPVVAARQERIDFDPYVRGSSVETPQRELLTEFGQRSLRMEEHTGLVSDASGKNNFGFSGSLELVLVDTIPLQASDGGASVVLARDIINALASGAEY